MALFKVTSVDSYSLTLYKGICIGDDTFILYLIMLFKNAIGKQSF